MAEERNDEKTQTAGPLLGAPTYRARILEKTGLQSNAALTRYVLENQLLD